ncbi:MAG: transglycosylase SLT domain-containing protein [Bryobacteraceae bacterium]|jgi:soluble lytic murein transglycosylase
MRLILSGEERVRGDPRGPGGPPYDLLRISVVSAILALALAAAALLHAAATGDLKSLVRAYRADPTPAGRAAVESYAAAHPDEDALARLALGVVSYEQKDYAAAIAALQPLPAKLPQIADYAAFYLAAARVESNDFGGVAQDLGPSHAGEARSPLAGKAWLLEARALQSTAAADAVKTLREHYTQLPQPDGALVLADSYQAANDLANASDFYRRVYIQYPNSDAAATAEAALLALKDAMGAAFPAPLPQQLLRRADRLLELHAYAQARTEYEAALDQLAGFERDTARVRMGAADYLNGKAAAAYSYLAALDLPESAGRSEADAERLYYMGECAHRLNNDDGAAAALRHLGEKHPKSPWRLRALISQANRFLVANRVEDYLPLYKAVYEGFPADPAAATSHWKVAFHAYLHDRGDAGRLLQEHLESYPAHGTAGAALYFLGRVHERGNNIAAARACYQRLAEGFQNGYYAMLARGRLRAPELQKPGAADETVKFLEALKTPQPNPIPTESTHATALRIERSRLLRGAGLTDLADAELRYAARTDAQPALVAMEMAGADTADAVPYLGVKAMKALVPDYLNLPVPDAPREFWQYLFPMPYRPELVADAQAHNLDPNLVAGLIRQESEFNPDAVSPANADGLMQVRPGTGAQFARAAGIQGFTSRMLFQPEVNLKLGTAIFRSMLDKNGGSVEQTLAAYNAGPNRAAEWITWNKYREPAEFVESIPFTETRDYVQAVIRNAEMYRRLYP